MLLKKMSLTLVPNHFISARRVGVRGPSGQSYKGSTIVNYDSRVVPDLKIPHITTLGS